MPSSLHTCNSTKNTRRFAIYLAEHENSKTLTAGKSSPYPVALCDPNQQLDESQLHAQQCSTAHAKMHGCTVIQTLDIQTLLTQTYTNSQKAER